MADVPRSGAFRRAVKAAVNALRARDARLFSVLEAATRMSRSPAHVLLALRDDLAAAIRMVREFTAGRYRKIPHRTIVVMVAALVYLADPIDLIPDMLPGLGLVDDAVLLGWVFHQLRRDLDDYLAWEREWGGAIDIDPIPDSPAPAQPEPDVLLPTNP
jgi:uncharacterized membrane protein YkvA (DUF1232 family)